MFKQNFSYYNYFLVLSMVLIGGYFVASLFFINKTSDSDEKAESYRQLIEETDAILKHAYQMESHANGYLLNDQSDSYIRYKSSQCDLKTSLKLIRNHSTLKGAAVNHFDKLDRLFYSRLSVVDTLLKSKVLGVDKRNKLMEQGSVIMDDVVDVLYEIRTLATEARKDNKSTAIEAGKNAVFMFSVFGVIMMMIVVISFDKMRKEIKKNEQNAIEIAQINKEISEVNENLASFAYIASHDLNEPLRKVRIFGDLLLEEVNKVTPDKENVSDTVQRMQKATNRMQELIDDLLMYSRVSNAEHVVEQVDVKEVVENVIGDLQPRISDTGATVVIESLPHQLEVDKTHIRQLFQNLISNAIKFRKKEEPLIVTITSEKIAGKFVKEAVNLAQNLEYWKIQVADNGIGMDEKYKDKIFAVFQRLHGRNEYKGTGIGLSICKKIVSKYKGDITVHAKEGEGATFIFFIPTNV